VAYHLIRERVPFLADDVALSPHIEVVRRLVREGTIKVAVEEELGMA
jgi:histidine ammonia-lyase